MIFFLGDFQQYLIQWNPYTMKQFRFPSTHLAEHYSRISHRLGMNLTNSILFKVSQCKGKRRDMFGTIFCQTMVSALQIVITVLDMYYILSKELSLTILGRWSELMECTEKGDCVKQILAGGSSYIRFPPGSFLGHLSLLPSLCFQLSSFFILILLRILRSSTSYFSHFLLY